MRRLRWQELSAARLAAAATRRLAAIPHQIAWQSGAARDNKGRLELYRARHFGQRCFILGNGPSLAEMDLSPLKNEVTFGMNRVYLLEKTRGFLPTYYVAINDLVLEQFASDIAKLTLPRFLTWSQRKRFDPQDPSVMFVHLRAALDDRFIDAPLRPLSSGGTVTYVALQLAFFMGFAEVVLVGVDHHFADRGEPNRVVARTTGADQNHFHPDYFPTGVRWQLPDLLRSEMAYARARHAYEQAGRRILDATMGGQLQVFEKANYEEFWQ